MSIAILKTQGASHSPNMGYVQFERSAPKL